MTCYVLNHCNKWHEYASFSLIGVVDEEHLNEAIEKIKAECCYTDEDIDNYIDINGIELNDLDI